MAISRQLVEMMGGSIGAESTPASGSIFWFTLKLGHSNLPAEQMSAVSSQSVFRKNDENRKSGYILVVEDNIINQQMTVEVLRRLGHKAEAVSNGPDALTAMSKKRYDLVLMDIQLAEMNGLEVAMEIRNPVSMVLNHNIPVIAMTAYVFQGDREKCLSAGMQDYLAKPIAFAKFAEVIEKWIA
ncbi:MAG: response regulator [Victivallaceae bacterium]